MEDNRHGHNRRSVVYLVDEPVVPDSDTVVILSHELTGTRWMGILAQVANMRAEALLNFARETAELPESWPGDLYSVDHASLAV